MRPRSERDRTPPYRGPMWQVVLGLRSLLVKIAVFVVMAALLAWALGGTLWPRTSIRAIGDPVACEDVSMVLVHQVREPRATFGIARVENGEIVERTPRVEDLKPEWRDAMTMVSAPGGVAAAFAFKVGDQWRLGIVEAPRELSAGGWRSVAVIDRMEAARQLARFAAGLSVQDEEIQRTARDAVLDAEE